MGWQLTEVASTASFRRAARNITLAGAIAVFAGCASPPQPLYMWGTFPKQQYETLLRAGASSPEQIALLEAHAEKARGAGAALPPGFRAHLGMLKLAINDPDAARALWQAEKIAFPESATYMDQLLKRMDASRASPATTAPSKDNPA